MPTIDPQFGSHAVIQRGKPILLTAADRGERLTVTFAGASRTWRRIPPGAGRPRLRRARPAVPIGFGSADRVHAATADDIMIGDVWLCSGQSNMEYPLRRALNGDGEVQSATDADLRLMKVPNQLSNSPRTPLRQGAAVATLDPGQRSRLLRSLHLHGRATSARPRRCRSARSTTAGAELRSAPG